MTRFEQLGGEGPLRLIIQDFVGRVFADTMIGFFFAKASQERITRMEYEHAAQWLGAPIQYSGRSMPTAHAKHPIMGGHFARRRQILAQTLRDHRVDEAIVSEWLAHVDSLRADITGDPDDECNDARARERAHAANREEQE